MKRKATGAASTRGKKAKRTVAPVEEEEKQVAAPAVDEKSEPVADPAPVTDTTPSDTSNNNNNNSNNDSAGSNGAHSAQDEKTAAASSSDGKALDGTELKLVSWNVAGLRALLKRGSVLHNYVKQENPDIICLQETKINDEKEYLRLVPGYHSFWNCSKAKKGYSGTAILSKERPINVTHGIGIRKHDTEGRVITAEFDTFHFVCAYVPNAGQKLDRLQYRVQEWDVDFRSYLKTLEATKPVVLMGDLNVAHLEIDIHNPVNKHKSAGFTPQERASFTETLTKHGFVDSFRHLYPARKRAFTYFSFMGNAKAKDCGWRLDYCVITPTLLPRLVDVVIRREIDGSDHVPLVALFKRARQTAAEDAPAN